MFVGWNTELGPKPDCILKPQEWAVFHWSVSLARLVSTAQSTEENSVSSWTCHCQLGLLTVAEGWPLLCCFVTSKHRDREWKTGVWKLLVAIWVRPADTLPVVFFHCVGPWLGCVSGTGTITLVFCKKTTQLLHTSLLHILLFSDVGKIHALNTGLLELTSAAHMLKLGTPIYSVMYVIV